MHAQPLRRSSSSPHRLRCSVSLLALGALLAACDADVQCFDDAKCGAGQRCEGVSLSGPGVCVACDATEIPYDGIDNDCSRRTPDFDLDGDGQNSDSAAFQPGTDCDDTDPDIYAGAPELCGDDIDSDCDGEGAPGAIDDPECGDTTAPTVLIRSPANGARVSGTVRLRLEVADDTGVVGVALFGGGLQIDSQPIAAVASGEVEVELDTLRFGDGSISLRVEVRDRAGRTGATSIGLQVDNRTPPDIEIRRPTSLAPHAGRMPVEATLSDPDGVDPASVRILVDSGVVGRVATSSAVRFDVDTGALAEGRHVLGVEAADLLGNTGTSSRAFVVDRTGPIIAFESPRDGATVSGTIQVIVTATDASGLSSLAAEGQTAAGGRLDFSFDTTTVPNGAYALTATAADGAVVDGARVGNVASASLPLVIDNVDTSPLIRFVRPSPGARVLGPTDIELDVQRGDAGNRVEVRVDGLLAAVLTRNPWTTSLDLRGPAAGTRTIDAVVTDGMGRSARATVQVTQAASPRLRLPRSTPPAGGSITDFEIVDFDGDGILDIVTSGARVELFGGARPTTGSYTTGGAVQLSPDRLNDIELVDLDGDQDLDLVGVDRRELIWALNTNGVLASPPSSVLLPDSGNDRLAVADIDGDGDPDAVVAGAAGAAGYVYEWSGGSFRLAQTLGGDGNASDVAIEVADGDTLVDVVVARDRTQTVSVFRNDGRGTFGAGIDSTPARPGLSVAVGDVTGDGYPDLVLATDRGPELLQGSATSPGAFTSVGVGASNAQGGVAIGDVDGDGALEVVALDNFARAASIWGFSGGALVEENAYLVGIGPLGVKLADVDGNGALDVFAAVNDVVMRLDNVGGARLRAPVVLRPGYTIESFALGQVSGSTQTDIVAIDDDADRLRVLEGDGRFGFTERASIGLPMNASSFEAVAIGQIDGTGGNDIAAVMSGSGAAPRRLVALANASGGFDVSYPAGEATDDVAVANLDGAAGGEIAFVLSSRMAADNGVAIIDAAGAGPAPLYAGQGAFRLAVGRFDASSSVPELAVANAQSENVTVHSYRGGRYLSTTYNAPTGLEGISVGPVGNSSTDDLIGVAGDRVFVMASDPVLGFRPPQQTVVGRGLVDAQVVDVSRDGRDDIVTVGTDVLYVLVSQPGGGLFAPLQTSYGAGASRMLRADVDGDGREDLVSAHPRSDTLIIVPNDDERF